MHEILSTVPAVKLCFIIISAAFPDNSKIFEAFISSCEQAQTQSIISLFDNLSKIPSPFFIDIIYNF